MSASEGKATGKATEEENARPPTKAAAGGPCRENITLLSWYEEAMKEKPRPIEDALKTVNKHDEGKKEPWKQECFQGSFQQGNNVSKDGHQSSKEQQEEGGWTMVLPKWKKRVLSNKKVKQFSSPMVEKEYAKLLKERKCFRCFAHDHKRAQCREPLKCLKCFKCGHVAGRYTTSIKPGVVNPKQILSATKQTHPSITYAHATRGSSVMGDLYLEERPDEEDVFMPAYSNANPVNAYLERAAYINIIQGNAPADMEEGIKITLAGHHGGPTSRYRVLCEDRRPVLLVCDDVLLRNAVVQEGPYDLLGVRFNLAAWEATTGMAFQPPGHHTWIKLHNLPYQFWNPAALTSITARLGTIKDIMPYGLQAYQFDHISLLIDSNHPRTIPKNLRVREGDYTRRVRVQVVSSRPAEPGYFQPPPHPPQRRQHWEQQQRARPHPYHNMPRATSPTSGDSYEASNRWSGPYQSRPRGANKVWVAKPVAQPNAKKVVKLSASKKEWVVKPVTLKPVQNAMVQVWKQKTRIQSATSHKATTDQVSTVQATIRIEGDNAYISLPNGTMCKVTFTLQSKRSGLSHFSINWPILTHIAKVPVNVEKRFKKLTRLEGKPLVINEANLGKHNEMTVTNPTTENVLTLVKKDGKHVLINFTGQSIGGTTTGPFLGSICRDLIGINSRDGLGCEIQQLLRWAKEIIAGPNEVNMLGVRLAEEIVDGPNEADFNSPPGFQVSSWVEEIEPFEGEPEMGLVTPPRVRRSPRLKEKSGGPYKSVLERAKAVQGYEEKTCQPRTPKIRVKPQKPRPEYLKSMAQLSKSQAEAVLMTAGIDCDGELQAKIEAVLCNNSGGRASQDSDS